MKEVTRIHLAKTTYDIEVDAKQALADYFKGLRQYEVDEEAISDIEARMVELLELAGVISGSVITSSDVDQLIEKLGQPNEIMSDELADPGEASATVARSRRRLFRSSDQVVLGGVLGGVAEYFAVNPLWVRLLFIILAMASFGLALVVYVVLWISLPQVKTVADRLELRGQPVTAAAIRHSLEADGPVKARGAVQSKLVRGLAAFVAISATMMSLIATAVGAYALLFSEDAELVRTAGSSEGHLLFTTSAIAGGVLLSSLFGLMAYAALAGKFQRRTLVAMGVVALLGLVSLGGMVAGGVYSSQKAQNYVAANNVSRNLVVDGELAKVRQLKVDSLKSDYVLRYKVSSQPKVTVEGWRDQVEASQKNLSLVVDNKNQLTVSGGSNLEAGRFASWPVVTIYGPAIEQIDNTSGQNVSYFADSQQSKLSVSAGKGSVVELSGAVSQLTAKIDNHSELRASDLAVKNVQLRISDAGQAELANINQLEVEAPLSCRNQGESKLEIGSIASQTLKLNGKNLGADAVDQLESSCLELIVASS